MVSFKCNADLSPAGGWSFIRFHRILQHAIKDTLQMKMLDLVMKRNYESCMDSNKSILTSAPLGSPFFTASSVWRFLN